MAMKIPPRFEQCPYCDAPVNYAVRYRSVEPEDEATSPFVENPDDLDLATADKPSFLTRLMVVYRPCGHAFEDDKLIQLHGIVMNRHDWTWGEYVDARDACMETMEFREDPVRGE